MPNRSLLTCAAGYQRGLIVFTLSRSTKRVQEFNVTQELRVSVRDPTLTIVNEPPRSVTDDGYTRSSKGQSSKHVADKSI